MDSFHSNAERLKADQNQQFIDSTLKGIQLNEIDDLKTKVKQLESDIKEYKDVIDSLKQKLDVIECLYEDLKEGKDG